MRFRVRNTFYLKISRYEVLPLYLYLDERHVEWMSERTLNYVISDLRPLVGPKLEAERNVHYGSGTSAKKGSVDVHRGDTYQFAFFLRKAVPHAVVMKTRNYVMTNNMRKASKAATKDVEPRSSSAQPTKGSKAGNKPQNKGSPKKGKGKQKAVEVVPDSEPEEIDASDSGSDEVESADVEATSTGQKAAPRRSTRNKVTRANYRENGSDVEEGDKDEDAQMEIEVKEEQDEPMLNAEGERGDETMQVDTLLDEDEEEKKLKPKIQLSFRSLQMRDLCLCVVVEPWPVDSSAPDVVLSEQQPLNFGRQMSMPPPPNIPDRRTSGRAATPLFLPDLDERRRSVTPAPSPGSAPAPIRYGSIFSNLETMDEQEDPFTDTGGMMAFSQALIKVSGDRMGVAGEDEDEMDSGALYGDADEMHGFVL